jgi:hypothetical protein
MGTGVMIGAGIFALTGQFTELAGKGFVFAFLAAVVAGFSAYSIVMDIMIHWGVLRHLRREVGFCLSPGTARLSAIG